MQPILSYLVPSFNHAPWLPAFLDSLEGDLSTLGIQAEIIIIDDGSSDASPSILENWLEKKQDSLAISVIFQENQGLNAVLNRLINLAQGDYLRLCATDDCLVPGSSQRLLEGLQKNPRAICAVGDGTIINEKSEIMDLSAIRYHGGNVEKLHQTSTQARELIRHWCLAGPCHLIKRSHFQSFRYQESETIDDFDLFLSLLALAESLVFVKGSVCLYRIHSSNISKTRDRAKRIKNHHSFLKIINRYLHMDFLKTDLRLVKFKTLAKIHFLQRRYVGSFVYFCLGFIYGIKW